MTWIVGKNATILTFPEGFFADKHSIGINHAAMMLRTEMAFSGYPILIKQFLTDGFPLEKIIGVKPSIRVVGQFGKDDWPNHYPDIRNDPIYYDNHTRGEVQEVAAEMKRLWETRDATYAYHNNDTSLHVLIYWCVLHNRYPMRLCGCNQTRDCMSGVDEYKDIAAGWVVSQAYTREIIRCLNTYGDIVRFYEDYTDCLEKEKQYASLCEPTK